MNTSENRRLLLRALEAIPQGIKNKLGGGGELDQLTNSMVSFYHEGQQDALRRVQLAQEQIRREIQ